MLGVFDVVVGDVEIFGFVFDVDEGLVKIYVGDFCGFVVYEGVEDCLWVVGLCYVLFY